jgi:arylsulfatase A-like enzyme
MIRTSFAALVFLFLQAGATAADRPNVIFILADDLGYTDLGCQHSGYYETPAIDRLAAEGMRFKNHHHAQNCQPTRAALMSGQYGARTGVYTVGGIDRFDWSQRPLRPVENVTSLPLDLVTIAESLKSAGYATAMFGKWHLGEKDAYHPAKRGFDEAIVSSGKHFNFTTNPPVEVPEGLYLADFLTDKAEDFIRRKKDEPFFLYLPHFGVHSPYQAKQELIEHFKKKAPAGGHHDPVYAAMIASVDESVGRILALLEELELAENTIVVFSSDNGGVGGYTREGIKQGGDVTDNAPLRSGKGSQHEGGTRVPLIMRWPGVAKAGSTCDTPTIHVDLPATFLEMTGAPAPDQARDGESLVALLKDPAAALKRTAIYQHMPGYLGAGKDSWRTTPVGVIQEGDWKLMEFFEDGRLELYDLASDLGETKNLASANPDKTAELHTKLKIWRAETGAAMPTPNSGASTGSAEEKGAKKKGEGKGKGKGKGKVKSQAKA